MSRQFALIFTPEPRGGQTGTMLLGVDQADAAEISAGIKTQLQQQLAQATEISSFECSAKYYTRVKPVKTQLTHASHGHVISSSITEMEEQ